MLRIAIFIGIYSYLILFLGLIRQLYFLPVLFTTLLLIGTAIVICKKDILTFFDSLKKIHLTYFERFLVFLFGILVLVNLVGALGPELAFDSLWYHLTIPKIFAQNHSVFYIEGNLFYYSLMPKLTEMLYVSSLILTNEIVAKLIHFVFGLLTSIVLFKFSRLYLKRWQSLLVVLAFYSNLVVMWLSITAFSDLTRAFFELLALFEFALFTKHGKNKHLVLSSVLLGFAIATKLLSIGTLLIFVLLILIGKKRTIREKITQGISYAAISLLIPMPWFVISYYYTQNPIYPLFSQLGLRNFTFDLLSPLTFIKTLIGIFIFSPDPISPIYIMLLPIVLIAGRKILVKNAFLPIYCFCTYAIWYVTSQSGGARFLTAYFPAYTLLACIALNEIRNKSVTMIAVLVIISVAFVSVLYRGMANVKYLPVIFGLEPKNEFLMKNLNFSFGDFYDENREIEQIVGKDRVLMKNTHNLFYVNFPYTLDEWGGEASYQYILVQGEPWEKMNRIKPIYMNSKTHTWLYKL